MRIEEGFGNGGPRILLKSFCLSAPKNYYQWLMFSANFARRFHGTQMPTASRVGSGEEAIKKWRKDHSSAHRTGRPVKLLAAIGRQTRDLLSSLSCVPARSLPRPSRSICVRIPTFCNNHQKIPLFFFHFFFWKLLFLKLLQLLSSTSSIW